MTPQEAGRLARALAGASERRDRQDRPVRLALHENERTALRVLADLVDTPVPLHERPSTTPSRLDALEALASAVRDTLGGLPDHPWIPGGPNSAERVRDALYALDGDPSPPLSNGYVRQ